MTPQKNNQGQKKATHSHVAHKNTRKQGAHNTPSRKHPKDQRVEKEKEGIISITSKGVGYVTIPPHEDDIEISPEYTNCAFHGDTVMVEVFPGFVRGRKQGRVSSIVARARTQFVGTAMRDQGVLMALADNRRIITPFVLSSRNVVNPEPNDKILFELEDWSNQKDYPLAKVLEIIGKKGDNNTEMRSIALERGFREGFTPQVENAAKEIHKNSIGEIEREAKVRRDFRMVLTFTIDPIDAKDFDDAISYKELDGGKIEVGVHIADVSHYVTPNSILDQEAQKRGVSVYLVDRTIPMLPEVLSNDLCSLNPNEDKLTFSAVFTINKNGEILDRWYGRTIIRSIRRFTYEEAQQVIETGTGDYVKEIQELNRIAKIYEKQRSDAGAVSFEQDEVKFKLDEEGKPLGVYRKTRFDAHKLVEEWMLLANRGVAEYIEELNKDKKNFDPLFLYRIHNPPHEDRIENLTIFLKALGYDLPDYEHLTGKDLNALFEQVEGRAEESMIKTATVRSMAKAIYTTKNIGHFGLAFDFYTHFTSPIRRYPDVMVHRLLQTYLDGKTISKHDFAFYENMAVQSTDAEIRAAEAERESIRVKQVAFMSTRLGQVFDGVISGVTEWGLYIEDKETKSEGMVRIKDLEDDFYNLDQKNYRLVGERTKKTYSLGQQVRFMFTNADPERKSLDCKLVEPNISL